MPNIDLIDSGFDSKKGNVKLQRIPFLAILILFIGVVFHLLHYPFNGAIITAGISLMFSYACVLKIKKREIPGIYFWLILSIVLFAISLFCFAHVFVAYYFFAFTFVFGMLLLVGLKSKESNEV